MTAPKQPHHQARPRRSNRGVSSAQVAASAGGTDRKRSATVATAIRCNSGCKRGCDMTCPRVRAIYSVIRLLKRRGFTECTNTVDEACARSVLFHCSNCGSRGDFDYIGLAREHLYRAFMTCRRCAHWIEM